MSVDLPARLRQEASPGTTLRPSGSGVAAPRVARRAKRGGARRDRTADLLHAMQALSQLSYGPLTVRRAMGDASGETQNHSSGIISSLFIASDVTNDVGHVLIALFVVGNERRIIVIVVVDGLVGLDIVLRFGDDGLDLAGVLLGIGLLERDRLFGFRRLRRGVGGRRRVPGFGAA